MSSDQGSSDGKLSPPLRTGRRRSSICSRKSIVPSAPLTQTNEVKLKQYIQEADNEGQEWRDLYLSRRSEGKNSAAVLMDVLENPPRLSVDDLKNDLTDEDLEFLGQKPDYDKLDKAIDKLVEEHAILKVRLKELDSKTNMIHFLASARFNAVAETVCSYNDEAPL